MGEFNQMKKYLSIHSGRLRRSSFTTVQTNAKNKPLSSNGSPQMPLSCVKEDGQTNRLQLSQRRPAEMPVIDKRREFSGSRRLWILNSVTSWSAGSESGRRFVAKHSHTVPFLCVCAPDPGALCGGHECARLF